MDSVRLSFGGGEETACGEVYSRLCRGDNRERGEVGQRGVLDVPMARDPDELKKVCGRCPGIAEDSTLHWRGFLFKDNLVTRQENLNKDGYQIQTRDMNERTKQAITLFPPPTGPR